MLVYRSCMQNLQKKTNQKFTTWWRKCIQKFTVRTKIPSTVLSEFLKNKLHASELKYPPNWSTACLVGVHRALENVIADKNSAVVNQGFYQKCLAKIQWSNYPLSFFKSERIHRQYLTRTHIYDYEPYWYTNIWLTKYGSPAHLMEWFEIYGRPSSNESFYNG